MRKLMKKSIVFLIFMFLGSYSVSAASIQISSDKSSVIVGNTVTFTVTISGGGTIGQAIGTVGVSSNLSLQPGSSGESINYFNSNNDKNKNLTYTYKYKATSTGTATLTVSGVEVGILETGSFETPGVVSKSITVISSNGNSSSGANSNESQQGTVNEKKEYSSDNYLKSLEIEGYEYNPNFDRDTLEYKLAVDEDVLSVNIKASCNDDKATLSGTGEVSLSGGENTINIKVVAENGTERIYKILIVVEDKNPIHVSVGKKKYTVVKKNNDLIEKPENYQETSIKIDNQDVVAYLNPKTKVTLVILKDENNKVNYFVYDASNHSYTKYRVITVSNLTLQLLDSKENLKNFKKYKISIQGETVDIYKIKESHKVGLIYGTNVATGNTSYYVYDKNEETLSKYYDEEVSIYKGKITKLYNLMFIGIGIISLVVIVVILISIIKGIKKRNKHRLRKG